MKVLFNLSVSVIVIVQSDSISNLFGPFYYTDCANNTKFHRRSILENKTLDEFSGKSVFIKML